MYSPTSTPSPTTTLVRALYCMAAAQNPDSLQGSSLEVDGDKVDGEKNTLLDAGSVAHGTKAERVSLITKDSRIGETGRNGVIGDGDGNIEDEIKLADLSLDTTASTPATPAPIKKPRLAPILRFTTHTVTAPPTTYSPNPKEYFLTSWRMADHAYKMDPCPFPTRARGLFTQIVEGTDDDFKIVARGYDKFFNVGEVSWTMWENVSKHSTAPYELTHKANGCIILISALSPSNLLVTSKHSLGPSTIANETSEEGAEPSLSHAMMGEKWLEIHLARVGKRKDELAYELWKNSLTAVAELCDDAFEEHVLPYPPHLTGLHLHGLNRNTTQLHSLQSSLVQAFAAEWGLIPTLFSVFPSVLALKTYCEEVERAGGVEEDDGSITPVEGFVVRGRKRRTTQYIDLEAEEGDIEPFFWKVKFIEPYLTYRSWREITKSLLLNATSERPKPFSEKRFIDKPLTALYAWWVNREINERIEKFVGWSKGRGIISIREEFIIWSDSVEGRDRKRELGMRFVDLERVFDRTLIVPVAVPGCGKTSLGVALAHLFGWGHTQNDDFNFKKPGPHFIKAVQSLLKDNPVVYADKNNHLVSLRSDLLRASLSLSPRRQVRMVALHWPISSAATPQDVVHSICASRIVRRGANHQTLRAGEDHEGILARFIGAVEGFGGIEDVEFDHVLEMDIKWSQEESLKKVLELLVRVVEGLEMPEEEKIQEAMRVAAGYKPVFKKAGITVEAKQKHDKKLAAKAPRYYGLAVEIDLKKVIGDIFDSNGADPTLFKLLVDSDRVELAPHITLVHEKERESLDPALKLIVDDLWIRYSTLIESSVAPADAAVDETPLVVELILGPTITYDSRVMSLQVSSIISSSGIELRDSGAHITIGTIAQEVRPIEGKWLMEKALKGETETEGGLIRTIKIEPITCKGRLAGMR